MKKLVLLAALAATLHATLAHAVRAEDLDTATIIDNALKNRNAHVVYTTRGGQFYHRYDHIVTQGVEETTPERALGLGFGRCPQCLPPASTKDLEDELANGGPHHTKYYAYYLDERKAPLDTLPGGTQLPPNTQKVNPVPMVIVPNNGQYQASGGVAPAAGAPAAPAAGK